MIGWGTLLVAFSLSNALRAQVQERSGWLVLFFWLGVLVGALLVQVGVNRAIARIQEGVAQEGD